MSKCMCMTPRPTEQHKNRIAELEGELQALREAMRIAIHLMPVDKRAAAYAALEVNKDA